MTVASSTSKSGPYTGNGVTTAFAFAFKVQQASDIKVVRTVTTDGVAVDTTLTSGVDYTVSVNADQSASPGGSVTTTSAPTASQKITILRNVTATQGASIPNQGGFYPKVVENALDKLTMLVQQLSEENSRALKLSVADSITSLQDLLTVLTDAVASAEAAESGASDSAGTATTQAGIATAQAATATAQANIALAQAAAAVAAAASIGFKDVIFITAANSPYTVEQATSGSLLNVDTSGGNVVVNLPTISGLALPFTVGVKKATSDANTVTINRGGTDQFDDGTTSSTLAATSGVTLVPDTDTAPDKWTAISWGGTSLAQANTWTGMQTFRDNKFEVTDDVDTTKKLNLQLSGITAGQTRTAAVPDRSGTLALQGLAASVASAATVNLDTATGDLVHITGTTTITAITLASGTSRDVVFDGALTLTHNAATLILPGGANITTAAGDRATFRGDGAGNVRCMHFTKADGTPVVPPASQSGLVPLQTYPLAGASSVDVEGAIDGTYDRYLLVGDGIKSATAAQVTYLRAKMSGAYQTGAIYNYRSQFHNIFDISDLYDRAENQTNVYMQHGYNMSNESTADYSFQLEIICPSDAATHKKAFLRSIFHDAADANAPDRSKILNMHIQFSLAAALTGIRIYTGSGTFSAGTLRLYGVKKP